MKHACITCAAAMSGMTILEGCAATRHANYTPTDFLISNGYILLRKEKIPPQDYLLIKSPQLSEPVLIVRRPDQTYIALQMKCTHMGASLKVENNQEIKCNLHGSRFTLDGQVMRGPAKKPLKTFPVEIEDQELKIKLT